MGIRRYLIAALIVIVTLTTFAFGVFSFIQLSRGKENFVVADFSEEQRFQVQAPTWPFKKGVLFFEASGRLSAPVLVTLKAEGEVLQDIELYGPVFYETFGGPDYWKDELELTFHPSRAQGAVSVLMRCGR